MGSGSQVMLGGVARNVCRVGSREARILTSTSATNASPTSSLSTTSSSEAQEALKHVDRLDRNRDGTKRLNYAIVGPSELSTVNNLLYATYHPYEPLTSHLGLCNGLNSMKDMDRMVESYLVKNLTLIAYDRGTGRPVGAAVNNSCHKDELNLSLEQELNQVDNKSYQPIQAIHHQLRHDNGHIFEEIGTNKMFSIKMIGIGEEDRGQGVATNLIRGDRNEQDVLDQDDWYRGGGPGSGGGHEPDQKVDPLGRLPGVQGNQDGGHRQILQRNFPTGGYAACG